MKTWIFLALSMSLTACGTSSTTNRNAGEIPVAMACPSSQDPSQGCPSPSLAAVLAGGGQMPTRAENKQEAALRMKPNTRSIEGRCELWVAGDKKARPCTDVKVMVRSDEKGEMRDGEVEGFGVRFTDLNEARYKVIATSEDYTLTSTPAEAEPGKRILVKIKARPRTR